MKENLRNKRNRKYERGITLVALVVTIVVLLILAGVSIVTLFGENGIITAAQKAKNLTEAGVANDLAGLEEMLIDSPVQVKLANGKVKKLTKENFGEYLGKEVTNYTGATSVTIGGTSYKVSPTYRLYYVDFDGKYGEKGSIYLKADCTSNNYALPITDTSADTATNIKIKHLNPGLYNAKDASENSVNPPTATNINMKAVTWLTNTTNWESLKTGVNTEIANKINYIVGSPSLEMMMDSYNTHYGLTGNTPDTSTLSASTNRVKLFYKYPYNTNNYGYGVGPSNSSSATNGYYTFTSNYSVKADTSIDSMYYPGSSKYYWLASPSAKDSINVMIVYYNNGGYVTNGAYSITHAICPLVSLKSSVQLELGA